MNPHELRRAFDLVIKYQNLIEEKWYEYFRKSSK